MTAPTIAKYQHVIDFIFTDEGMSMTRKEVIDKFGLTQGTFYRLMYSVDMPNKQVSRDKTVLSGHKHSRLRDLGIAQMIKDNPGKYTVSMLCDMHPELSRSTITNAIRIHGARPYILMIKNQPVRRKLKPVKADKEKQKPLPKQPKVKLPKPEKPVNVKPQKLHGTSHLSKLGKPPMTIKEHEREVEKAVRVDAKTFIIKHKKQ